VQAQCSPNVISVPDTGATFQLNCKIGEEEVSGSEMISLYPNPTDGHFRIAVSFSQEITTQTTLDILDQVGSVVFSQIVTLEQGILDEKISISHLPAGFYSLRITCNRANLFTKLVIQKS
jgi:hypothetical protein